MASAKYRPAPEVEKIANELIPKYHQHLLDFDVKIRYVFVDKTPKSKGKEIWGTCRKVTGLNAFLEGETDDSDPFFVVTISEPIWDVLPQDKRVALVDHELCHASAEASQKEDEEGSEDVIKLSIRPHDLEEFSCIVRRHGLWYEEIRDFVNTALKAKKPSSTEDEDDDATGHDEEVC